MGAGFDLLPDTDQTEPSTPLPQVTVGEHLREILSSTPSQPTTPDTILFTADDAAETMMGWAREAMGGRELGGKPLWVRFYRADQSLLGPSKDEGGVRSRVCVVLHYASTVREKCHTVLATGPIAAMLALRPVDPSRKLGGKRPQTSQSTTSADRHDRSWRFDGA